MDPDLRDLLTAWMGGEIDPSRSDALLERVRRDEAFRLAFVAEIRMLGMLKAVQSAESRWLRLEDELGWSAAEPPIRETLEDGIVRQLHDPPRLRPWRWGVAAAAAVLLVAGLAALYKSRGPRPVPVVAVRPFPKVDTVAGLALVVKLDGVRWEASGEPHPSEGDVLASGRLRFRSGRVTLSMLTGVVLVVEGPADVELVSSDKVLCHRGRLRARVPHGAEGFVVAGPGSAVVDLGTEFGLNIAPDGKLRGKVFKGEVEAALLSASGTPQRSQLLRASKDFEIDPRADRIGAVARAGNFIAPADLAIPPLVLDEDYPAAIRRSRPWGYWRFESLAGGATPNEVAGRPPLRANGPIHLDGGGGAPGGNRSAVFRAGDDQQFLVMDGLWRPTWRPGYAVELWCSSEAISHASLVSMPAPKDTDHHLFLMELTSRNRLTIHKPASVRFLHRWPPGWEGGDNTYSPNPYVPYRWHHIVSQINGDRMELYVDGEPAPSLSVNPEHADTPCQLVLGRLTTLPGRGLSISRPFVGRMDEVALYDRPLTPEEIRDHHRLGTRRDRGR